VLKASEPLDLCSVIFPAFPAAPSQGGAAAFIERIIADK